MSTSAAASVGDRSPAAAWPTLTPAPARPWWRAEPARLERDRRELGEHFPDLSWFEPDDAIRQAGGWRGQLPLWPFERPRPEGLDALGDGLRLELVYPQAWPVVAPWIYPLDPEPDVMARTEHRWHVNGNGSLCLLQSAQQWRTEDSLVELLLKAAGWRIEFALVQADLLEAMTEAGIVTDPTLDPLLSYLAPMPPPTPTATEPGART